ncbi:MAG: chromosome segregation protein SMC [Clostridium sp.]
MFLKSLEIRGFKSFADKTNFKFKQGVTAVVGPNGSGKSNISDSVRWVLGEQSVKALRGGKMEDVIFAGTQFRKPVGFAQVSLTLDNTDGELGTDYSEVTITRRIFRSGETEYLMNNQKCRLKDINQLFMDTGIGKEGYSLIGQGKIDSILSGKPEERRSLLEEAAGIVKFKSRKEEAEKKLSNTEGNLIRIRDIISTYEERIGPLKLEREKALKYKELADELKIKEVSTVVQYIRKIEKEIKVLTDDIRGCNNLLLEKRKKLDLEKNILKDLEIKIEYLEEKNNSEKKEYYSKKEESSKSINDIELFKERIKNLLSIIEKNTNEVAVLDNDVEILEVEKKLLKNELDEKLDNQIEKEENIKKYENNIKLLNSEIQKLEKEVSDLKDEEFELLRKSSEINNTIAVLNKDILNTKQGEASLGNSLKSIEDNISINIGTSEGLRRGIEISKLERENIKRLVVENKKQISSLLINSNKKDGIVKDITKRINNLEGKYTTLSDLEKSYEGYNRSVKNLMDRIEKGIIPKAKDNTKVLGDIFTVDKKNEIAIEISLAGAISNVITENELIAKELIRYLTENKLGRATFLPLNIIKGNRVVVQKNIINTEGYVGIASDLINFDSKYKNIMDYSLGRTIIATDMDAAIKISKLGNHKLKIVTLNGEIVSPGGALTGGSIYSKNSNILGRKREIQELEVAIKTSKEMYNKESRELREIKIDIKNLDDENLNKHDKIHEKNIEITRFDSEIKSLESEGLKLRNSLELSTSQLSYSKKTLLRLEEQIIKKEDELTTFKNKDVNNKYRVLEIERNLELKKVEVERFKEDSIEIKLLKATLDEWIQGRTAELSRNIREIQDKNNKIITLNIECKEQYKNIQYLEKNIKEKDQIINVIKHRIIELEEVFKEDEIEKITLKEKLKIKDGLTNELIDIIRVDENDLNRKEIANAKFQSEKEGLYKKLNEELGLTLAEADEIAIQIENILIVKEQIYKLKLQITALGIVNLAAIAEYEEVCGKYEFMASQEDDLNKAKDELLKVILEMTNKMQGMFKENFKILNENFNETFRELFKGGTGELILSEGDELTANIEINVQPPGKKLQNINLMSGGEKVLSAIALLFAILKMKPTPFCILDEIEAALDDANVYRYAEFLTQFSDHIQFIVITHRKGTMEASDMMYGITMEEKGISKVVSVDLSKNS